MTTPVNENRDQAQVNTRANLFYFLQSMARQADDKGHQTSAESPGTADQLQEKQPQDG